MNPRAKNHPKLNLSSLLGSGSSAQPTQTVPSQLKPTRLYDASFVPSSDDAQPPSTCAGIPVEGSVTYGCQATIKSISFPLDEAGKALVESLKETKEPFEVLVAKTAQGKAVALDEKDWEALQALVDALAGASTEGTTERVIVISGILPPPLITSSPSTRLHSSAPYATQYLPRLTELSLVRGLHLKLLPPVLATGPAMGLSEAEALGSDEWWNNEEELKRVLRLYVTPAMECLGSHRLIYGSSPVPSYAAQRLLAPDRWTECVWPVVAELVCAGEKGEAEREVDMVFDGNARRIWG